MGSIITSLYKISQVLINYQLLLSMLFHSILSSPICWLDGKPRGELYSLSWRLFGLRWGFLVSKPSSLEIWLLELLYHSRILMCYNCMDTFFEYRLLLLQNVSFLFSWFCFIEVLFAQSYAWYFFWWWPLLFEPISFWEYDYPIFCIARWYLSIVFCCTLALSVNCCSLDSSYFCIWSLSEKRVPLAYLS